MFLPRFVEKKGVMDDTVIHYNMSKYFLAGITALVADWVRNDCKDSVLFIAEVIILCVRPKK